VGIFGNYGITVKKNAKLRYPDIPGASVYQGAFIFGLDLINEMGDNETSGDEENF